jgi:hypothetical protein
MHDSIHVQGLGNGMRPLTISFILSSLVTQMIEFIQLSRSVDDSADTNTEDDVFSPFFIWVVRDFSLSLKIDQRPCTADEYLEHALKDKPGTRNLQRNEVRKKIREFFPTRKCFTLKRCVS